MRASELEVRITRAIKRKRKARVNIAFSERLSNSHPSIPILVGSCKFLLTFDGTIIFVTHLMHVGHAESCDVVNHLQIELTGSCFKSIVAVGSLLI